MEQNDVRVRYQNLLVRDPPFALYDRGRVWNRVGDPLPHRREALVHAATLRFRVAGVPERHTHHASRLRRSGGAHAEKTFARDRAGRSP